MAPRRVLRGALLQGVAAGSVRRRAALHVPAVPLPPRHVAPPARRVLDRPDRVPPDRAHLEHRAAVLHARRRPGGVHLARPARRVVRARRGPHRDDRRLLHGVLHLASCSSSGLLRVLTTRGMAWRSLAAAAILTAVMGVTTVVNTAPSILYWREHGKNDQVATRTVQESDFYALRPIQMLSPIPGHRLDPLASIADEVVKRDSQASRTTQWLGLVGAIGFLGLVVVLLGAVRPRPDPPDGPSLLLRLASLTGDRGGARRDRRPLVGRRAQRPHRDPGLEPHLRSSSRSTRCSRWASPSTSSSPGSRGSAGSAAPVAAGAIVLVGGGQSSTRRAPAIVPDTHDVRHRVELRRRVRAADRANRRRRRTPCSSCPTCPYPEAQLDLPPYGMQDYDPFRGYLHSDSLALELRGDPRPGRRLGTRRS